MADGGRVATWFCGWKGRTEWWH